MQTKTIFYSRGRPIKFISCLKVILLRTTQNEKSCYDFMGEGRINLIGHKEFFIIKWCGYNVPVHCEMMILNYNLPPFFLHITMRRREEKENTSIMKLNGFYFAPQQFNTRSLRSHTRYVMIWNYFCLKANKYFLYIEISFF